MIGLPGAGDPPHDVKLHQPLEETGICDLEEDEALCMLLQADQDIALDVAELQRRRLHTPLPATTISRSTAVGARVTDQQVVGDPAKKISLLVFLGPAIRDP